MTICTVDHLLIDQPDPIFAVYEVLRKEPCHERAHHPANIVPILANLLRQERVSRKDPDNDMGIRSLAMCEHSFAWFKFVRFPAVPPTVSHVALYLLCLAPFGTRVNRPKTNFEA